jgi:hypothetical protein
MLSRARRRRLESGGQSLQDNDLGYPPWFSSSAYFPSSLTDPLEFDEVKKTRLPITPGRRCDPQLV